MLAEASASLSKVSRSSRTGPRRFESPCGPNSDLALPYTLPSCLNPSAPYQPQVSLCEPGKLQLPGCIAPRPVVRESGGSGQVTSGQPHSMSSRPREAGTVREDCRVLSDECPEPRGPQVRADAAPTASPAFPASFPRRTR